MKTLFYRDITDDAERRRDKQTLQPKRAASQPIAAVVTP
ncbi:hypothetical protein KPSA1_03158 [Pseudomonas syringae pv. actinidiae]|uniref:Uncharacterized protein n=1 Tax=Pseudomonas syringae pv. actinidiae TaxID=103796 RepID=A0A2V0QYH7_PSESF|nr:hypothetical protein KPSA1_03158 [Pseudomonas syringae pv. actinidiae]GBH18136.1 hypothetical protein KPSA3_04115 [Pseudomonas syringae pv. actinidiae]